MEKIVIISSQPDKDLIALLNMLFPDCEIRVASSITGKALGDKVQSLWDIKPPEGE